MLIDFVEIIRILSLKLSKTKVEQYNDGLKTYEWNHIQNPLKIKKQYN